MAVDRQCPVNRGVDSGINLSKAIPRLDECSGSLFPPPRHPGYNRGMDEQQTNRGGPLYWLKRRSRRFWIGVVLMLPVLYPLSWGPLTWMLIKTRGVGTPWGTVVDVFYAPLYWALHHAPGSVVDLWSAYHGWWAHLAVR